MTSLLKVEEVQVKGRKFAILIDTETKEVLEGVWDEQTETWETDFSYMALGIDSIDVAEKLDFEKYERITDVIECDPNKEYNVRMATLVGERVDFEIYTDGKKKQIDLDEGRTEQWQEEFEGTSCFEQDLTFKIENATWVLVEEISTKQETIKTLYIK